jgi:hypothetical protein
LPSKGKPGKLLKKQIPVRAYYTDADKKVSLKLKRPTTVELRIQGEFCLNLTATDIYSGWVELRWTLAQQSP